MEHIGSGQEGCPATPDGGCVRTISALGTPLLWWMGSASFVVGFVHFIKERRLCFVVCFLGVISSWIPWVVSGREFVFTYYALVLIPFLVIHLSLMTTRGRGKNGRCTRGNNLGAIIIIVIITVADFLFMYPLYSAQLIPEASWLMRLWLPGWS